MDQYASITLAFPPSTSLNDDDYDRAAQTHLVKLSKLLKEPTQPLRSFGVDLLQALDPEVHSLSYLAILHTLCIPGLAGPRELLLEKLVVFLLSFDARQLRYAGTHLLELLNLVGGGQLLPPSVAVEAIATAILRLDPTGSVLTSTHINLAKLAYNSGKIKPALEVIDKNIVFYPGMSNHKVPELYCDMSLSPSVYISRDSGLTTNLKTSAILEYDLLCGMMHCTERDWAKASAAFERVVTYPSRDQGASKIMSEAFKKWALVNLLEKGKYTAPPSYTGAGALKVYNILGKLYKDLAALFETENAAELKEMVDKHTKEWLDDGNIGLVQEVLAAYQEWQIINLQHIYSKISIHEIRLQTRSAQTGQILPKDEDVETLIQNMIISGALKGVIEKNDNGATFLTFLPSFADLSEAEFAKEISGTAERLKNLQAIFQATNERLGTSKEYIKHLVREQRRGDKDAANSALGFESQVDDEDLMGGITASA
ncbi:COP9 signalosome complex subunit 3 [Xylariales sp. PMI_506]|nr:COP9 signalosome complex subunit 3 [Xylariales sp. PMI_506]